MFYGLVFFFWVLFYACVGLFIGCEDCLFWGAFI